MSKKRNIRVLVTGGPTRAYLDRVRFLSNISSGALAFTLCEQLKNAEMDVILISGPSAQPFGRLALKRWFPVETTDEMHRAVIAACKRYQPDFAVFTAAVLDFAPERVQKGKVASSELTWKITLKPTPKIIDEVGKHFPKVKRIGFKLEWKKPSLAALKKNAQFIIDRKELDALCLNYLPEITGSRHPAFLLSKDGKSAQVKSKAAIARWIKHFILVNA